MGIDLFSVACLSSVTPEENTQRPPPEPTPARRTPKSRRRPSCSAWTEGPFPFCGRKRNYMKVRCCTNKRFGKRHNTFPTLFDSATPCATRSRPVHVPAVHHTHPNSPFLFSPPSRSCPHAFRSNFSCDIYLSLPRLLGDRARAKPPVRKPPSNVRAGNPVSEPV